MNSIRLTRTRRGALGASLAFGLCCTSAWATCSSTLSGTTATVTCGQNTDSLTLSQFSGNWYHTGPVFGVSAYDWNSSVSGTQYLEKGGTIHVVFPDGGKLHIGNGITPAYALIGGVSITNPASSGTQVYFDAATGAESAVYTIDDAYEVAGVGQLLFVDSDSLGLELIVSTGTADDVVNIRSVCSCDTVLAQGTAGNDSVYLGRNGSTQLIGGPVTLLNNGGFTEVTIDDHADATARTANVTSTGVTGIAPAPISWNYYDIGPVLLTMGGADDTVNVRSLEDPFDVSSLTIQGTSGEDKVYLNDTGSVQAIKAPVSIANSGGLSAVQIIDTVDPLPHSATFTATGLSGLAPGPITWVPGEISTMLVHFGTGDDIVHVLGTPSNALVGIYLGDGNDRGYVNGGGLAASSNVTLDGGSGDDLFVVSAVPISSGLSIYGGIEVNGDELVYTSGPAAGAIPGNGTLDPTDPNARSIYYNSIELFNIDDWIFSGDFE